MKTHWCWYIRLRDYFKDPNFSCSGGSRGGARLRRRYSEDSFDADESLEPSEYSEYSEWTVENECTKDDSFVGKGGGAGYGRRRSSRRFFSSARHSTRLDAWDSIPSAQRKLPSSPEKHKYSYQICLFIQMQLCHPKTLADWIRERNHKRSHESITSRIEAAAQVFSQLASGLAHVHKKGIIHRDLKPANCFTCIEEGFTFKIGDFGLSKLIETASHPPFEIRRRGIALNTGTKPQPLLLEFNNGDDTSQTAAPKSAWIR